MGSLERRQRHRAELRAAILEAALEIISEQGLGALSIRAVAERVEYSAAAIYLHFESKEALLREVAHEGFRRMHQSVRAAVEQCGDPADPAVVLRALARAYLAFALDHTAYFRVMFDVTSPPGTTSPPGAGSGPGGVPTPNEFLDQLRRRDLLEQLAASPSCPPACAEGLKVPLAALATVHGLVSLFLSGRLSDVASTPEELLALLDDAVTPYALH